LGLDSGQVETGGMGVSWPEDWPKPGSYSICDPVAIPGWLLFDIVGQSRHHAAMGHGAASQYRHLQPSALTFTGLPMAVETTPTRRIKQETPASCLSL
jgi:hypothetical protein